MKMIQISYKVINILLTLKTMTQFFKKNLGRLIAYRRAELGYTQAELANLIGLSRAHLARLERGGSAPPLETLMTLNKVLNINLIDNNLIQLGQDGISKEEYQQYILTKDSLATSQASRTIHLSEPYKTVEIVFANPEQAPSPKIGIEIKEEVLRITVG